MIYLWLLFIIGGFLLGSVMFSQTIPALVAGKDVSALGEDRNPGAANVFMKCGVKLGIVCLFLDMLKGFVPVFAASLVLDCGNLLFSLVIAAPVLGHAIGLFNRFHGGKCIATSFGVLIGLLPLTFIGFLLAALYILFSTVIKISPNSRRSILTFLLFSIGSLIILHISRAYAIALGCLLISLAVIVKHLLVSFELKKSEQVKEKTT